MYRKLEKLNQENKKQKTKSLMKMPTGFNKLQPLGGITNIREDETREYLTILLANYRFINHENSC